MRNVVSRSVIVLSGIALIMAVAAWPAGADSLFPSSLFTLASAPQINNVQSMDTGFLSGGLFSIQNPYAIQAPSLSGNTGNSYSTLTLLSPQINDNMSNNVALGYYNNVIAEFPNQTNLFAPLTY
jgi:hypothetical protein